MKLDQATTAGAAAATFVSARGLAAAPPLCMAQNRATFQAIFWLPTAGHRAGAGLTGAERAGTQP